MKGLWDVTTNIVDGEKYYQVYRLIDAGEVDHSGNREYIQFLFKVKEEAQICADRKNKEEALHG